MIVTVFVSTIWLAAPPALADPNVVVRLTVERIRLTGGDDGCGDPDWYVKVFINGQVENNEDTPSQDANEGDPDISPNWEFSRSVDLASLADPGRIPLSVELWEEDGGLCFEDDQFDASQSAGDAISGTGIAAPCGASLDGQAIACGTSSVFAGASGDNRGEVTLRIEIDEPPSVPGLRINCLHSPAWPQAGDSVTITATGLDGALAPLIADSIEIWLQPNTADATTRSQVVNQPGVSSTTHVFTPDPALPDFAYGCKLTKDGQTIFSSWHRTRVGGTDRVVPILFTGPRASRLDIVFIADNVTYTGPTDPMFLADVVQTINISYYGFDQFLASQDKFNFWLASDMGRADDADSGGCDHDLPSGWDGEYAFADAGAILHRQSQRDCALRDDRIFSGTLNTGYRSDAFQVVTHETGHQPFGLADEYCCDGGYFQTESAPNVYEELSPGNIFAASPACTEDAGALGRDGSACHEWDETVDWWFDPDFATSEPTSNDIMEDNGAAQAADIRRYNLIFAGCQAAGC